MSAVKYHIAKSGEAVRCSAKFRCRLQHLDERGKLEYDALFASVFSDENVKPRIFAKAKKARQLLELPGYDLAKYKTLSRDYYARLSAADKSELGWYIEQAHVNHYLRDPAGTVARGEVYFGTEDRVAGLDAAVARGGLGEPTPLYRGIALSSAAEAKRLVDEVYTPGAKVSFPEFLSTSINAEVALSFATGDAASAESQPVLFRLVSSEGAPLDVATDRPVELEVLLPRNKEFTVQAVSRELVNSYAVESDVHDPFDRSMQTIEAGEDLHGVIVIDLLEVVPA